MSSPFVAVMWLFTAAQPLAVPLGDPEPLRVQASVQPEARLKAQPLHPKAQAVRVVVRTSIEGALTAKAGRQGRPLAAEAARLLRWRGPLAKKVRPGDTLTLLYAPPPVQGLQANPTLLGLRYEGERLQMHAYRFAGVDGIFRYYDASGQLIEPHMVDAPVPAYEQITEVVQSGRGLRRHRGVDLKAPEGARVVLPFSGTIRRLNWSRRFNGQCVEVQLDAGYLAHFLHLQRVSPALRVGAHVPAGTTIGTVGNTGHSSGPHLHYELLRAQRPVEPLLVHGRRIVRLGPEAHKAFVPVRDAMVRAMPKA